MNGLIRRTKQHIIMRSKRLLFKSSSTAAANNNNKEKFNYDDIMRDRQAEAKKSIVVQVSSEKSFFELYNYCSAFGNILNAQHYRIYHDDDTHYILLEFADAEASAAAIDSSSCNDELQVVPVRSPFLWFRAAKSSARRALKVPEKGVPVSTALNAVEGTRVLENSELEKLLSSATCIEEQIMRLHRSTRLNDLGVRLRFLAALQVQSALSGMFPDANAQPFGSSVNGFGKMGCDLDLILRFNREKVGEEALQCAESRLVFHTKENLANGRSQVQRQLESIGDILQLFLPGVCNVRRILQARIPIIKYHHKHLNLEVDLSMSNLSGFYMSELLYMFGELDERVRPLTFVVRRWAHSCGLTNPMPGRWISNFSLTCLVMFFLQQLKQPVLPSINALIKSACPKDIRITEDGVNCTFGRELQRLDFKSRNSSQISLLLLQFFEFYSQFDFQNKAISLNEGRGITKPDHSALYIVNPLEQILNVSKNVSLEECERLRIEVRNAAWLLESEFESAATNQKSDRETPWGLLNIFKSNEKPILHPHMFFKPRMMDVNKLFESPANTTTTMVKAIADDASTTTSTSTNIIKPSLRQELKNIKAQARIDLKQVRLNATTTKVGGAKGRRR